MWQIFLKGGPVMYPLLLCSLIVFTITIERIRFFLGHHGDIDDIRRVVLRLMDKEAPLDAIQYLQKINHPVARMLQAGMISFGKEDEILERNLREAGEIEIRKMEKGLGLMDLIVTASPLLGLLGTVVGIIRSFQVLSIGQGLPSATALSRGLAEALITTAAGLMIAIPTIFIIHWINGFVERRISQMNQLSKEFLESYRSRGESK